MPRPRPRYDRRPTPPLEKRNSTERFGRKRHHRTRTPSPHRSVSPKSHPLRYRHGHSRWQRTGSRSPSIKASKTSSEPLSSKRLVSKPEQRNKDTSESDRIERLESLVKNLIQSQSSSGLTQTSHDSKPNKNTSDIKSVPVPCQTFIPTFCPETSIISVNSWLRKIEQLSETYVWNEYTKINHMQSKLSGVAKTWFDNLTNYNHSWSSWKRLLKQAFPACVDFAASLKEMLVRVKLPDETMASYYQDKMQLLHLCDIEGKKAVSCIIDGLPNTNMQLTARAGRYEDPDTLYTEFLSTIEQKQHSTAIHQEQNSTAVRQEQNSTAVRQEQNSTAVRQVQNSTTVRQEQNFTAVRQVQNSTAVRQEQNFMAVRQVQNSTAVRQEQNSMAVRQVQNSTAVRQEQNFTAVRQVQNSTAVAIHPDSKQSTSTISNNEEQKIIMPKSVRCAHCRSNRHDSAACLMHLKKCGVCSRLGYGTQHCRKKNIVVKMSVTESEESVHETWDLEKAPCLRIDPPPTEVRELPRLGGKQWQSVNTSMRSLCEEAVDKVKQKIIHRRILLKPVFRDFDKHNNGHVSRNQMRQALRSNGILLSDEEVVALEERFNNDMGFNYVWFLKDVEPRPDEEPLYTNFVSDMKKLNKEPERRKPTRVEQDIVQVMAKVKGKVVRERIRVLEFLRDFDKCNEQVISRENFKRGLSVCKLELTENEIETLMDVFASPMRRECVDYKRFSDVVEEAFTQQCLERAPLIVPVQHVPTRDCEKNFLNFDERRILSIALQKLAKKPDLQMNLSPVLQDFDKTNCGTVSVTNFLQALTLRGMNNLISSQEFDTICKCFSFERGMRNEVDYRAFMKALDILYATEKYNPF